MRVRGSWRLNKDCNIQTPTLIAISVVSFSFSWCSTGGPEAQLPARWWLSLLHLITNWSSKLHWGSRGPLQPGVAFPTTSCLRHLWSPTVWLPVLTELYNSSTPTQSPTHSLEWHVWSSSSGNNCHAVHRSLSSGASVYECTMGFFTLSHFISQICPRDLFWLLMCHFLFWLLMCHFLPAYHLRMACLAGSKVKIQQIHS